MAFRPPVSITDLHLVQLSGPVVRAGLRLPPAIRSRTRVREGSGRGESMGTGPTLPRPQASDLLRHTPCITPPGLCSHWSPHPHRPLPQPCLTRRSRAAPAPSPPECLSSSHVPSFSLVHAWRIHLSPCRPTRGLPLEVWHRAGVVVGPAELTHVEILPSPASAPLLFPPVSWAGVLLGEEEGVGPRSWGWKSARREAF